MELKIIYFVVLVSLVKLVNGYVEFEPSNQAMNNSLYEEVLDEQLCDAQIRTIRRTPLLTMYFADAGIRVPRGILTGNTLDMGNYHQCININQQLEDSELQGKYCVIDWPVNQNIHLPEFPGLPTAAHKSMFDPTLLRLDNVTVTSLTDYYTMVKAMKTYTGIIDENRVVPDSPFSGLQFRLAVCVPKPCTTRQAFDSFLFNISAIGIEYTDIYCRLPDDKPWVPADIVATVVFSVLGFITLASTSYDLWHTFVKKTDPKTLSVVGKSFSVYTNGRRLMTFTSASDTVECLDGIRALAMAWVVLGHTFSNEISVSNPLDVFRWTQSWQFVWVGGAHYSVDTFFTLSGFLVVYTTVGKLDGKKLLKNLHLFYLNRLLRMFPLLATAVLLEASYLNHLTDGPDWTVVAGHVNRCRSTWWSTLLHIQNYMTQDMMCLIQAWYLAIDVQLHILCPIILVWVLWGKKNIAWTALSVGCLGVLTASTIYIFINKFPPVMVAAGREDEVLSYVFNYYMNTLTRAPPFLIGMIFGYAVRVLKIRLTGLWVLVFWTLYFAATTYLMYFNYPIGKVTWDNQFMSSFYNSFFRSFWAIAIGCLIYACMNGFAGPINWFLSLQIWKLPSRISYGIYLFHYMLMIGINNTAVAPFFFSVGLLTFKFLAHCTLSFVVAFVMTLVIDAPFSTLFKLVLGGGIKKPRQKDNGVIEEPTKETDKKA